MVKDLHGTSLQILLLKNLLQKFCISPEFGALDLSLLSLMVIPDLDYCSSTRAFEPNSG